MVNVVGVDHIVLVVSDIKTTQDFYSIVFGKELEMDDEHSFHVPAGNAKVFFALPSGKHTKNDRFNENRIGLDHLAFRVTLRNELEKVLINLKKLKATTLGIEVDKYGNKEYICFRDPDNIQVEFYLRIA